MAGPESRTEQAFVRWCRVHLKKKAWKLRDAQRNGFPDRTVFIGGGRTVCIEFKAPKGVLSQQQVETIAELGSHGIPVLVTSDIDEAKKFVMDHIGGGS